MSYTADDFTREISAAVLQGVQAQRAFGRALWTALERARAAGLPEAEIGPIALAAINQFSDEAVVALEQSIAQSPGRRMVAT